ncbi:4'-phosphopantetheinyl transferase superfamily protein [archaeon]|jgi:phosphopantetheine--protein transferase-like protein|nr:4'-phosphopantetheinyl transferase superfamily protein [archaeon]MBT4351574.1 4'-phosphopantetheinyl transferase superfamily protein [archaeon]MBT4648608.1 4'-phosphopantetheinyl transferase superfamily protein [archaeon]MBT6821438.1 4'-phosphopantetheinyl transferase superfamily protein [archaeon]MBT7393032.1 4'-phosphopantetheinyl transferase superfamily protein [archaeon]
MKIHTGIDMVKISNIEELIKNPKNVEKTFSESELIDVKPHKLAGIFALKEAFFKASQIKIKKWKEIVVKKHDNGKPYIVFDNDLIDFKVSSMDCSISHDGEYVIGNVVLLED